MSDFATLGVFPASMQSADCQFTCGEMQSPGCTRTSLAHWMAVDSSRRFLAPGRAPGRGMGENYPASRRGAAIRLRKNWFPQR
jgi:hypothetical protein